MKKRQALTSFFSPVSAKKTKLIDEEPVACPFCNSPFSPSDIESHVAMHIAIEDGKVNKKTKTPHPPALPLQTIPSSSSNNNRQQNDVFATMMTSSQLLNPKKATFILYLDQQTNKLTPIFKLSDDPPSSQTTCLPVFDTSSPSWSSQVKIRGLKFGTSRRDLLVDLYTNIPTESASDSASSSAPSNTVISASMLKSMLQKAVRRRKGSSACKLAYELYRLSPSDLLRRLPIIMIEDAAMHPGLPILIFCMLADSKGYQLSSYLVLVVMQVLMEITLCPLRDIRESHDGEDVTSIESLPPHSASRCIITSLLFRLSFGGMACDTRMLHDACCGWKERLCPAPSSSSSTETQNACDKLFCESYLDSQYLHEIRGNGKWGSRLINRFSITNLETQGRNDVETMVHDLDTLIKCHSVDKYEFMCLNKHFKLDKSDLILEGICFHCDFQLIPFVLSKLSVEDRNRLNEDKMKSLIWLFRASVNNHKNDSMDHSPKHTDIQASLDEKKINAKDWSVVARFVNAYCEEKREKLWRAYSIR